MKSYKRNLLLPFVTVMLLALFFNLLYTYDNKYKTPPPYGRDGVMVLEEADFFTGRPLILTNGWLLTDSHVTDRPTYIGEFANLQHGDSNASPHGKATYRLTLCYTGEPIEAVISFPQLFSAYIIDLDDRPLTRGIGSAKISFTLTEGDHQLTVRTVSKQGYYSGMYHPPMLGGTETVFETVLTSCIAYGIAFFVPLALMLFTFCLWRSAGDRHAFWFGLLCGCFSLYVSYYFIRLLHLPFGEWWYLAQSAAFYGLCLCTLRLTALAGNTEEHKSSIWLMRILSGFSGLLLIIALLIPALPWAVRLHGALTDLYYIVTFCALLFLMLRSKARANWEDRFTLFACTTFGVGLLLNLLSSNLFEPIRFFWQFEWCGIFLVALFGATMVARNKRILAENVTFSEHLEELVEQRTAELTRLLKERKAFFADMAHDLKAPIYATRSFIRAIRENDTGVDGELLRYIDQVEQKQQEMALRVQSLTAFDRLDTGILPPEPVSVRQLLQDTFDTHHMAAEVAAVHLIVLPPNIDGYLLARPTKLNILFENLIFNALRATATDGKITISAELSETECHFVVADTGSGIPIEELPHIFERFYVGEENKENGSGIGLYLVKGIVEELHGEISVSSKPGQGATFYIDLPLMQKSADS